jgi:hypothetical protein
MMGHSTEERRRRKALNGVLTQHFQAHRYRFGCSDCRQLERELPDGIRTGWKTVPLQAHHK